MVMKTTSFTIYKIGQTSIEYSEQKTAINCTANSKKKVWSFIQRQICHLQYVCKNKTAFNLRLYNHTKKRKAKNAILACKNFQAPDKNLQGDAKFRLTEKIIKPATPEQLRLLKKPFWYWSQKHFMQTFFVKSLMISKK